MKRLAGPPLVVCNLRKKSPASAGLFFGLLCPSDTRQTTEQNANTILESPAAAILPRRRWLRV
jgi:hypothetical protein